VSGHSVIAVPVPELDAFVRARTERYDPSFVSADPEFGHAHLTLLGPWLAAPTGADLATVGRIVSDQPPFAYTLAEVRQFPTGVVYLAPEPELPFRRLAERLAAAFPQTPPYAGEFPDSVPHLTLDHAVTGASAGSVRGELDLPVHAEADRVVLQWWANDDCHVQHTWRLG
jgi:2'-5' RNA ligase superfamily protein